MVSASGPAFAHRFNIIDVQIPSSTLKTFLSLGEMEGIEPLVQHVSALYPQLRLSAPALRDESSSIAEKKFKILREVLRHLLEEALSQRDRRNGQTLAADHAAHVFEASRRARELLNFDDSPARHLDVEARFGFAYLRLARLRYGIDAETAKFIADKHARLGLTRAALEDSVTASLIGALKLAKVVAEADTWRPHFREITEAFEAHAESGTSARANLAAFEAHFAAIALASAPRASTLPRMIQLLVLTLVSLHAHAQSLNLFPNAFVDDRARCSSFSDTISPAQTKVIEATMAAHTHRLHHVLWHSTRNGWSRLNAQERATVQRLSPAWGRNAPLCPGPLARGTTYNPAGEEFLLMHHEMIDQLRVALIENGLPCIRGWSDIPQPGDPNWPVPPGEANDSSKSNDMGALLRVWSSVFKNVGFLQSHTLSEVGYLIEFSIHNTMHMRWAARPRPGDDFSPLNGGASTLSLLQPSIYDQPQYNWLGNPFSSAVNPVFWKLHGWIDDVVAEWLHSQQRPFISIAKNCTGRTACYNWQSLWTGGDSGHVHGDPRAGGPAGGGAPIGGGMPKGGAAAGNDDPILSGSLDKILPTASFRNQKFDRFLSEPRGGAGPGQPPSNPLQAFVDPVVFVQRFGPCSGQ